MASQGDPRVLLAMNVGLSSLFAVVVAWGLSVIGLASFTVWNVASLAILLIGVTYVVTR